jgi:hypothetical protein
VIVVIFVVAIFVMLHLLSYPQSSSCTLILLYCSYWRLPFTVFCLCRYSWSLYRVVLTACACVLCLLFVCALAPFLPYTQAQSAHTRGHKPFVSPSITSPRNSVSPSTHKSTQTFPVHTQFNCLILLQVECRPLRYKNAVRTSLKTHYFSATESRRLMLCKIWGFHGCDYEECRLIGYRNTSSYLTGDTLRLRYTAQPVNAM